MFTFDLEKAKSWRTSDSHVITSSLMDVFDNIHVLRDSVVDFCSVGGYEYGCLVGISYVV